MRLKESFKKIILKLIDFILFKNYINLINKIFNFNSPSNPLLKIVINVKIREIIIYEKNTFFKIL